MKAASKEAWFERWFDSPYYHTLYKHRDDHEARYFIENIIHYLKPASDANMLDMACGRGRHSIFLHQLGFRVTGVDLSPANIEYASKSAEASLQFAVHDMRNTLCSNVYDYVFNLFTSFGYFDSDYENLRSIATMATALNRGGVLVLDYLNAGIIGDKEQIAEKKEIDDCVFTIKRRVEKKSIVKEIQVESANGTSHFAERVELLHKSDFERYFAAVGLTILVCFGDYDLRAFNPSESPRMIFIAQKQ